MFKRWNGRTPKGELMQKSALDLQNRSSEKPAGRRAMRSDMVKRGFERAPHRSLLRATGVIQSEDDFNKPFIAIANSYTDIILLTALLPPPPMPITLMTA